MSAFSVNKCQPMSSKQFERNLLDFLWHFGECFLAGQRLREREVMVVEQKFLIYNCSASSDYINLKHSDSKCRSS